jgi:hypothetical protein
VLAAGICSMPDEVIPFKLNFKSFIISILVIMVMLRLLFVVQDVLLHRSWWWKRVTSLVKTGQWDEMAQRLLTNIYNSVPLRRRGRTFAERTTDGVEMETFEV